VVTCRGRESSSGTELHTVVPGRQINKIHQVFCLFAAKHVQTKYTNKITTRTSAWHCSRPLFCESCVRVQDFDFGINERDLHKLFPKIELPAIVSTMTKVPASVVISSKFV
jgi:hypothetical protein